MPDSYVMPSDSSTFLLWISFLLFYLSVSAKFIGILSSSLLQSLNILSPYKMTKQICTCCMA